jgi:hypothetical protein
VDPAKFSDKESFAAQLHGQYLEWQSRYLE